MRQLDRHISVMITALLFAFALGCASGGNPGRGWLDLQPRLHPNDHYQRVGLETAEMDVAECLYRADVSAPRDNVAGNAAINTLAGAAGGAALGAIGGAIAGDAGTGAAAGAAIGAAAGLGKTVYDTSRPQESYKGHAEACLHAKGYEVVSWR